LNQEKKILKEICPEQV